ncbi:hypothetical protein D3C87_127210 [compost metagenome]
MIEDFYYLDEGKVTITAASVGISKLRWKAVSVEDANFGRHIDMMKTGRFDHLPIVNNNGSINEYFKTEIVNDYENIVRHKIYHTDTLPLDTLIRDVINKFSTTHRTFYFLTYQKKITGLITLGNLNCKQVQIYIFSLICDLERNLADFVNLSLTPCEIKEYIKKKSEIKKKEAIKYIKMLEDYNKLISLDLENNFTEHFFFVDFFNIIKDKSLFAFLNLNKAEWANLSSINEIRMRIAHPTRSLIDDKNNIIKLGERLNKIDDLLFRLAKFIEENSNNLNQNSKKLLTN